MLRRAGLIDNLKFMIFAAVLMMGVHDLISNCRDRVAFRRPTSINPPCFPGGRCYYDRVRLIIQLKRELVL